MNILYTLWEIYRTFISIETKHVYRDYIGQIYGQCEFAGLEVTRHLFTR